MSVEPHPAGRHIWQWFLELSATRGKQTTIIAGMGGSQVIHDQAPITWTEKASWAAMTGRAPTRFENRCLEHMDGVYLAAANGTGRSGSGQDVGEYCGGKDVAECRQQFGAALERICSTCPN